MKYYYTDEYHTHGPFSLEELLTKPITTESWINVMGEKEWVKAKTLDALKGKIKVAKRSKKRLNQESIQDQLQERYATQKEEVTIEIQNLDAREKINPHIFSSIIALCGFLVFGILALTKSNGTSAALRNKNFEKAKELSTATRKLAYSGIFFSLGLFFWFINSGYFVYYYALIVNGKIKFPTFF